MKKPGKNENEISYWESLADGVIGLLLCVLLILMLLILYLMHAKEDDLIGEGDGEENGGAGYTQDWEHATDGGGWEGGEGDEDGDDDEDGGGGGHPYDDPDPGEGEGVGSDKAAILVQVVDGETQRTIKKQGIQFELYNAASALQVLSTYYPTKIDYKKFETDKEGVFYLPEKIRLGTYYLHDLTPIEGYDPAGDWEFSPDRDYDWDEPYLVSVEVFPCKNFIRLQLKDRETGEALTDASFDIVAAENIITKDGTTRYRQGEIVDTVSVDDEGYAESKELYLGKYLIRQNTAPEFYSFIVDDNPVSVRNKSVDATPPLNEFTEIKTGVRISVVDALYTNQGIENAEFSVTDSSGKTVATLKADDSGKVTLTNLNKNESYHIKQTATAKDYKMDPEDHIITVSDKGLVNDKEVEDIQILNSIVRISVSVKDRLFKGQLSDINIALADQNGNVIEKWNSSAVEHVIEGLAPGEYRLILNGNENDAVAINVGDEVEVQKTEILRWTMIDTLCITLGGLVICGILAAGVFLLRRRKSNLNTQE